MLQSYISRAYVQDFALISDTNYIAQNSSRILRAIFEICKSRNWGPTSYVALTLCKSIDKKMWSFQHPLIQFNIPYEIAEKLDKLPSHLTIEDFREMKPNEIGELVRHGKMGSILSKCSWQFPLMDAHVELAPLTSSVLRLAVTLIPEFDWFDQVHGKSEPFWIWVEDPESTEILYSDFFLLKKSEMRREHRLEFVVPIPKVNSGDGLPSQLFCKILSDRWIGSENIVPISFKHLILPDQNAAKYTDLLDLKPLPISALKNSTLENICSKRFHYFNPVQTQIFHTLYHTQSNALVGAPTGSGKTVAAELALWSSFRDYPKSKVVYIAPLKALVRERVSDWTKRLCGPMNRKLVELTGDVSPDFETISGADIIVTTPEKWDGVSRFWQTRKYVSNVSLIIIDEIHLLGGERGPILEIIVSRMKYMANKTGKPVRIVGLSTALANASDLADWLNIEHVGLFNFRHSVRPVPLEIYIEGYPGKHYCPRMMSMNKPTYSAILTHSPKQPVIVFVSSRRQTRLTAQDLISYCSNDENPRRFVHMPEEELDQLCSQIKDQSLKNSISFGIGLHHAGLIDQDRRIVEELFVNNKIQILIATSTVAW